jgi:uncharacterized repeat protein (TIGR01451 family)
MGLLLLFPLLDQLRADVAIDGVDSLSVGPLTCDTPTNSIGRDICRFVTAIYFEGLLTNWPNPRLPGYRAPRMGKYTMVGRLYRVFHYPWYSCANNPNLSSSTWKLPKRKQMSTLNVWQNSPLLRLGLTLTFGLALSIGLLLAMSTAPPSDVALAQAPTIRYVDGSTGDDSGNDCTTSSSPCATIQHAVDEADPGDEIRVAEGRYTDVQARVGITQAVYVSKTLTIRGGYTTTNWSIPYPLTQPTTLDAQQQGRVLYITGDISPTIEGLHITGGDAAGLGGGVTGRNAGAGVYVITATATLSNNHVFSNTALDGGGLYFFNNLGVILTGNTISNNTVLGWAARAGGLFLYHSPGAMLKANVISNNKAGPFPSQQFRGGAFFLLSDNVTLISNTVTGNYAANQCGGLCFEASDNATLIGNAIVGNSAGTSGFLDGAGGGLHFANSTGANLIGNTISDNSSVTFGGGICFRNSDNVTLTNNVIADNRTETAGSGLYASHSSPRLLHTTIARNSGGDGSGVYITGTASTIALTNTILVSHTVGITVSADNTAILNGVLWYSNIINHDGEGTIAITNEYTGNPAFNTDGYHLTAFSEAIDKGVDAGVADDTDGEPRPLDGDFDDLAVTDIGADEFYPRPGLTVTKQADPELVQAGEPLTYTLHVTNTGNVTLTATITDFLPQHVTPSGLQTWSPVTLAPDAVWTKTVVVTAEKSYCKPLINIVTVTTAEGASGVYTDTSAVIEHCIYLPVILKTPSLDFTSAN